MAESIDLTLQSVHGVVWEPHNDNIQDGGDNENTGAVSRIKACVSFAGSAPNMQVSSFTMCSRTGNLVVESNGLEAEEADPTISPDIQSIMCAKFDDPLESKRVRLSSSHSASSGNSGSSHRPHLQFQLPSGKDEEEPDRYQGTTKGDKSIELHITLRSDNPEADNISHEGIAHLDIPEKFESLPLTLDLPIAQKSRTVLVTEPTTPQDQQKQVILFDQSAYIRVVLSLAPARGEKGASDDKDTNGSDLVLSENLDEIQLGGIVKKMQENEEMDEAQCKAAKLLNEMRNAEQQPTKKFNSFSFCNGSSEFKYSFLAFFDTMRGCEGPRKIWKSKCTDPDQDLFLNTTMASTIDTRDSLEI
eukprot:CAMPEP_0178754828 /NCGR_PEP_ID=MMETSP0744-20121128/12376_1 /TAXON_ID=913974 /ORGANISM="Nitzschia punctata, Strain CCMP561" /LENGTH=359 /DNA_ID=CAMNT_0020408783 /DNA_START=23 /DNA_END=1102 /DNA_ORIENTATION=-